MRGASNIYSKDAARALGGRGVVKNRKKKFWSHLSAAAVTFPLSEEEKEEEREVVVYINKE